MGRSEKQKQKQKQKQLRWPNLRRHKPTSQSEWTSYA